MARISFFVKKFRDPWQKRHNKRQIKSSRRMGPRHAKRQLVELAFLGGIRRAN